MCVVAQVQILAVRDLRAAYQAAMWAMACGAAMRQRYGRGEARRRFAHGVEECAMGSGRGMDAFTEVVQGCGGMDSGVQGNGSVG